MVSLSGVQPDLQAKRGMTATRAERMRACWAMHSLVSTVDIST
jgi:hypothetical protein